MTVDDISTIVETAIADLPEEVQQGIDQVLIVVAENHIDPVLPPETGFPADFKGCYIGTVIEGQDDDDTFTDPPIGTIYLNAANLKTQDDVLKALHHEIGHVLGLSEEEVENLGMG